MFSIKTVFSHSIKRILLIYFCVITLSLTSVFGQIGKTQEAQPLPNNQTIEGELSGGQSNIYKITLKANEFLQMKVEQKGIDVVVRLFDSNKRLVAEMGNLNGTVGSKRSFFAEKAGDYEIHISALEKNAKIGKFSFQWTIKLPTNKDKIAEHCLSNRFAVQNMLTNVSKGTVVICTQLEENQVRLFLLTVEFTKSYNVLINYKILSRKIMDFWEILQNPYLDPLPLAQELYQLLIKPFEKDLNELNIKTILWSLDAEFRNIPISALHDGHEYMLERYNNAYVYIANYYTNILKKLTSKRDPDSLKILGLGVTKNYGEFSALPFVSKELDGIIREDEKPNDSEVFFSGKILLNEEFTEKKFLNNYLIKIFIVTESFPLFI